jgi:hypothetical protein
LVTSIAWKKSIILALYSSGRGEMKEMAPSVITNGSANPYVHLGGPAEFDRQGSVVEDDGASGKRRFVPAELKLALTKVVYAGVVSS